MWRVGKTPTGKEEQVTNTKEFKAALIRKGMTASELAERLNLSRTSLSYKMNNVREFRISEAELIAEILGLSPEEKVLIFFTGQVDKTPTS